MSRTLSPPSPAAPAAAGAPARRARPPLGRAWIAAFFLLPALILLGALVVYPIVWSAIRSLFGPDGFTDFVGLSNYTGVFTDHQTLVALKNNAIWVVVAPVVATGLGLIFAVLTERIRWGTAFKLVVFMPMAISMLAAGIIFRLVYDQDPGKGVANAVATGVHDTFFKASAYPGAHPRVAGAGSGTLAGPVGGPYTSKPVRPGSGPAALALVGVQPSTLTDATQAASPSGCPQGALCGTVWLDFQPGGGTPGKIDPGEKSLAGVRVEAVRDGHVVATATAAKDGTFALPASRIGAAPLQLRLPATNFTAQYAGVNWLGPTLVTWSIIGAYVWMWTGFAMVLIAAGLAGIPRELLEAARVDGAREWQVFRRITVPLLAPVLGVVLVTLVINVLKIFDLVYVIAPGASQQDANVLALQLYLSSFGGGNDQGTGSALAVLLLALVAPAMFLNIKRFRKEKSR
ncbi:carbohydrate ABC transporter permease [Streptomyces sporangiiformans]|uniref:Sugar ABC transporter permease n=1 Tax=Streptomyces sporangiiformans TaxID=2315329 RepID=A0A505D7D0_9ACTN|nr:sugar ABC transporter permease [Streptomyces sporangiiformans]TPQ18212.1 sugar ABC transporter permease [Streptomyces sporangiiformans]